MNYGNKVGSYRVRWKFSDNKEEVHVHFSTNDHYDCAKFWISVSRCEIIEEHNDGRIPKSELKKLVKETLRNIDDIIDDWSQYVDADEITFIDQNGRKDKWKYWS